ncbi:MAG: hypothetical protein IKP48_00405 [Bacteroidaceae bacterium]|nr:hypothetical protein [Bacteroidaceae bacterium]
MVNRHFLEQRGQSDACIGYAESRQNRTESIVNCQSSKLVQVERRAMLASAMLRRDKIGRSQSSIVNCQSSIVKGTV